MVIRTAFFALLGFLSFSGLLWAQDYKVDEVSIAGTRRVDPGAIRAAAAIKPGEVVTADVIDRSTQAIFRMARFSDVRVSLEERDGKNILLFTVFFIPSFFYWQQFVARQQFLRKATMTALPIYL